MLRSSDAARHVDTPSAWTPSARTSFDEERPPSAKDARARVDRVEAERVIRENAPFVWRAIGYLGVRPADVDDVCQEVFVVLYRRLPEFEGRSSMQTWIYGICLRVASEYRRRAWVRREQGFADPSRIAQRATEPTPAADTEMTLRVLLDQLDDDKRNVVVLYELTERPMVEVAEILGIPMATAYSRLYAARAELERLAIEHTKEGK